MSSAEQTVPRPADTGPSDLEGRVALVTGGARGIGAAISRSFASRGAHVAAGYSSNEKAANEFLEELHSDGGEASIHQGNVGEPEDCQRVIDEVLERYGRIDILVNNAGITKDKPFLEMDNEDWNRVVAVNLSGAFYMSRPILEHMAERGSGRIINISSVVGQMGNIGQANYAAAKSGLFGLTMTLAREAAQVLAKAEKLDDPVGLTINAVAPGFIETDMTADIPEKVVDSLRKQIPLARMGKPEEVARVVHFLCADASSYVTGQVWAVNGGMEM